MDSPRKSMSLSTCLVYLFLLFSTNLFTFFISTTFYSSSCILDSQVDTITAIPVDTVHLDTPVTVQQAPVDHKVQHESEAKPELPPEFLAFTSAQKLPFGFNGNMGSDKIYPPVGQACTLFPDELRHYMSYKVNGSCPDDELLAQKLLLKGCEPLPRRRCHPAASEEYVEPYPVPESLWATPSDSSVVWTAYTCKNYLCLIN